MKNAFNAIKGPIEKLLLLFTFQVHSEEIQNQCELVLRTDHAAVHVEWFVQTDYIVSRYIIHLLRKRSLRIAIEFAMRRQLSKR